VRAKRAGELTGSNPTDRGKRGTKYHIAVTGAGVPVACLATAANVNDTMAFERLFLAAFAVLARIQAVFADKGYDAEANRALRRIFRAEPHVHKRGRPRLRAGPAPLAGGAQQSLAAGEQTPRPAVLPAWCRAAPSRG
jgi:IS5 family transposase